MSFNILIVDDNENNRFTMSSLLEDLPVVLREASTGGGALTCLLKYKVDLVILDIQLPDYSGFEVATMIKNRKTTMHIPIIFATAVYKSDEFIQKGYTLGAIDYIMKPLNAEIFLAKVTYYMKVELERQQLIEELVAKNDELEQLVDNLRDTQDQLSEISYHDQLTGLKNRHYFNQYLHNLGSDIKLPVSLMMADVNGLKLINDGFGHIAGDELIQAVSECLQESMDRESIIARWGGDEFLVLLPNTTATEVSDISKRLNSVISERKIGENFPVSVAVGVATSDGSDYTINELIKRAEDQMYLNKMNDQNGYRSVIIDSLRDALLEQAYETKEHTERVSDLAQLMADELDLAQDDKSKLLLLGSLHDIGKTGISRILLNHKGELSEDEWSTVRRHPEIGSRICNSVPEFSVIADLILSHHERWDGEGYPRRQKGTGIPLLSRLIAIVDTYDVITHDRPYKKAMSAEWAMKEIDRCSGTQFDPKLVEVFLALMMNTTNGN